MGYQKIVKHEYLLNGLKTILFFFLPKIEELHVLGFDSFWVFSLSRDSVDTGIEVYRIQQAIKRSVNQK